MRDVGGSWSAFSPNPARTVQVLDVARRFYLELQSKVSIADELGISRFTVSRMLQEARDAGYVRIQIEAPAPVDLELSLALVERTGLTRAVVLHSMDGPVEPAALANAAATYLAESSTDEDVIGFIPGRTAAMILNRVSEFPECEFVQVSGMTISSYLSFSPAEIVRTFARRTRGALYPLFAPLLLDDASTVATLREQIGVAETVAQFDRVTRVLFSIGAWRADGSGLFGLASEADQERGVEAGAVAEVMSHLLDDEGRPVSRELSERCLTIGWESMARIGERVAIGWHERRHAVRACVRAGLPNTLFTDADTARFILEDSAPS